MGYSKAGRRNSGQRRNATVGRRKLPAREIARHLRAATSNSEAVAKNSTPEAADAFVAAEMGKWQPLLRCAGIARPNKAASKPSWPKRGRVAAIRRARPG